MPELNFLYRQLVLKTLRVLYEVYAKLKGRRFRCKTLAGEALFGCYVNSDMTVSCNCQDFDGAGQLGSLRHTTFEQLFTGNTAMRLRLDLARGRLPLARCAACFSMEIVRPEIAENDLANFSLPKGICVENTILCNLRCRSCCRLKVMQTRGQGHSLSLEDVDAIGRTLQRLKTKFCGYCNLGEPFFSPRIRRELEIMREYNPQMEIFISTNGILIDNPDKMAAALIADKIVFSIDGVSTDMVRRYQRGGNFEKAYQNMKDFVSLRDSMNRKQPLIGWKYIVFRWNDKPAYMRSLMQLAREAGVDFVQLVFARTPWYGMSWRFFSPFYNSLAKRAGRFRDVWLRQPGRNSLEIPPNSDKKLADFRQNETQSAKVIDEKHAAA